MKAPRDAGIAIKVRILGMFIPTDYRLPAELIRTDPPSPCPLFLSKVPGVFIPIREKRR